MFLGLIVLGVSILVIFGVLIGCALGERRFQARASRQAAMQYSLNRQWQELQDARKKIAMLG
jgi:uncharacterized membrane-anchored protein YhcB (DUF1043 family)